jgi:SAM-dependent methyltransferase
VGRDNGREEEYFWYMAEQGWSRGNLQYYLSFLLDGIDLRGKRVLDVGAGDGMYSFYAASVGAANVVALEPEGAGSASNVREAFTTSAERLRLDRVTLVPHSLQDYMPDGAEFDVLLLHASINHLDEVACMGLRRDVAARAVYQRLFEKLSALSAPGATLIALDCSPRNVFARFHWNPFAPTIEWNKHQPPELWVELLEQAGFENPRVRWHSFNTLRSVGRLLLGNRVASYFLTSVFCLTMTRAPDVPPARPTSPPAVHIRTS